MNRHASQGKERFEIEGCNDRMVVTSQGYQLFNSTGELIKTISYPTSKEEEIAAIFKKAIPYDDKNADSLNNTFNRLLQNVEKIYACKKLKLKEAKEMDMKLIL